MFYSFDLNIEINKLLNRFKSYGFKIITEIMYSFSNKKIIINFSKFLHEFNLTIKATDDLMKRILQKEVSEDIELQIMIEEKYLNQLYCITNIIMCEMGYDFSICYENIYWRKMQTFIKELWTAMPDGKPVIGAKKGFMSLFEDFHDNVINKCPEMVVKHLKDVGKMYRCRSWNVNDNYELMIPDERYTKDNRWNPDGIAYLYLACGDSKKPYDSTVNMVQKTCFEEVRLTDGSEVAICQFKPIKKDAKIIDLCYEGINFSKISRELKVPPKEYSEIILNSIFENPKLTQSMLKLAQENSNNEFIKKAGPKLNKLMKQTGLDSMIEEMVYTRISKIWLGLIDKSIFEVVDKKDDPELKAYIPFRFFSQYLIDKGYDGIIYKSTRMNKVGLSGKNLVLFNKMHATYIECTMKKYKYTSGQYIEIS
jgi:hypothetical protein